ncbi:hypothetical protein P4U78_28140, partial [Bacillus pseudomycoides]|nr:hypothetical protein [Bacillus pseudomycoides]
IMRLFPHTKNTSIKIITDTYDLERCFLSSHSQGSLQYRKDGVFFHAMDTQLSKLDSDVTFDKKTEKNLKPL